VIAASKFPMLDGFKNVNVNRDGKRIIKTREALFDRDVFMSDEPSVNATISSPKGVWNNQQGTSDCIPLI